MNELIILGTGTSTGIPTLGCSCKVCTSTNKKNKRFRTSLLIKQENKKNILIDASADFRSQAIINNITDIDAVILTHAHADHIHGIDDLRPYCFKRKKADIPIYLSQTTSKELIERFPYIFRPTLPIIGGGIPKLTINTIPFFEHQEIEGGTFIFFELPHGHTKTTGFVHSKFAYVPDCSSIDDNILLFLKSQSLEILIIDCLKYKKHETHLNLAKALNYIDKIGAKFSGLIHMAHDFEHEKLNSELFKSYGNKVSALYDSQVLHYAT